MGAAGEHPALLEPDDLVGQGDRGLPVGDDHDGRGLVAVAQGVEDARLDRRVDGAGRVVQDQQPRTADDGPGQREPLPLAAGEGRAPLADPGVEAVGQGGDEAVGGGHAQRRPHLVVAVRLVEGDVAADGVVEEEGALGDERGLVADLALAEPAHVDAVEQHVPSVGSTSRTSSPASVDLPDPVGPTMATVLPAGTSKVTPDSVGRAVPVEGEADAAHTDRGAAVARRRRRPGRTASPRWPRAPA